MKKLLFLLVFIILLSSCSNRPRIHIDNYSGVNVKIYQNNEHWIDVPHSNYLSYNSLSNKPVKLNTGSYLITIKNRNDEVLDEFDIEIQSGENGNIYIMNIGNVITYADGTARYSRFGTGTNYPPSLINKKFFYIGIRGHYVFEDPPSTIRTSSGYDTKDYTKRLFINPTFYGTDEFIYKGKFKNGYKNGKGKLYLNSNESSLIYDGYWENNLMSGLGKYYFSNGDKFTGNFSSGSFKNGKLTYNDNVSRLEYEEGYWSEGKLNGFGIRVWKKKADELQQTKYEGEFKNGAKNGYGKYWYASGAFFEGFFDCCSEEKSYQTGLMTYKSGETKYGTWE